jgi:hypothetical protein
VAHVLCIFSVFVIVFCCCFCLCVFLSLLVFSSSQVRTEVLKWVERSFGDDKLSATLRGSMRRVPENTKPLCDAIIRCVEDGQKEVREV